MPTGYTLSQPTSTSPPLSSLPPSTPPLPASAPACFTGAVRVALSQARQKGLLSLEEESEWAGEMPSAFPVSSSTPSAFPVSSSTPSAFPVSSSTPSAFPISYVNPGTAQQQVLYETLPYSVMRELRRAIVDSGLKSSYVTGMLEGIANGYTMLPQDWKDLMRMLLSPAHYVVFDSEFKHNASALSDPQHTANELYGAGLFDTITAQATLTPAHFSRTATCVQRAFRKVPVSGQPLSSFVNIKQQHSEPYHQFIDRLKEAVTRQIDNTTAQNELMKKLAFVSIGYNDNINDETCNFIYLLRMIRGQAEGSPERNSYVIGEL
uniref:endogenous retrovirus group K member 9 Gag polyprotein-like n=1 Tax=Podarcis muralis TaxID=64176 RepID=UPI0010A0B46E|nr:endogenous retrovirus group K member 9 Gag polyprotein-like [Podarcis muralis]